jgi:hypothetical protein
MLHERGERDEAQLNPEFDSSPALDGYTTEG